VKGKFKNLAVKIGLGFRAGYIELKFSLFQLMGSPVGTRASLVLQLKPAP